MLYGKLSSIEKQNRELKVQLAELKEQMDAITRKMSKAERAMKPLRDIDRDAVEDLARDVYANFSHSIDDEGTHLLNIAECVYLNRPTFGEEFKHYRVLIAIPRSRIRIEEYQDMGRLETDLEDLLVYGGILHEFGVDTYVRERDEGILYASTHSYKQVAFNFGLIMSSAFDYSEKDPPFVIANFSLSRPPKIPYRYLPKSVKPGLGAGEDKPQTDNFFRNVVSDYYADLDEIKETDLDADISLDDGIGEMERIEARIKEIEEIEDELLKLCGDGSGREDYEQADGETEGTYRFRTEEIGAGA